MEIHGAKCKQIGQVHRPHSRSNRQSSMLGSILLRGSIEINDQASFIHELKGGGERSEEAHEARTFATHYNYSSLQKGLGRSSTLSIEGLPRQP